MKELKELKELKESDACNVVMKNLKKTLDNNLKKTLDNWEPTPLKKVEKVPEIPTEMPTEMTKTPSVDDKEYEKTHKAFLKEWDRLNAEPKYWSFYTFIRLMFELSIICLIRTETGPWTSLFALLVVIHAEMSNHHAKLVNMLLKDVTADLKDVVRVKQENRQRILEQLDEIEKKNKEIINRNEEIIEKHRKT